MAKGFTLRLAAANLARSRRMVLPYFIASALMSAMYLIISSAIDARGITNMSYGETTMAVLSFGRVLMTLFIAAYMFYLNSFLIKPRKKEFGLYGVLGLEKRHVACVVFLEGLLLNLGALVLGFITGCAFGQLFFQLLLRFTHIAQGSRFALSGSSALITLLVFLSIFLLTSVYNLLVVYRANPIALLSGEGKAEKKARFVPLKATVGAALLALSYYLAVAVQDMAFAVIAFWPVVMLVIVATYLLFGAGSAFALSFLCKRKQLYYTPRAFITLSFLKYRMKQNAAGLSNICILSTMVLVTVVGCCSLYFGQEAILSSSNPHDISLYLAFDSPENTQLSRAPVQAVSDSLADEADAYNVTVREQDVYEVLSAGMGTLADGVLRIDGQTRDSSTESAFFLPVSIRLLPAADYAALTGQDAALARDEILLLYDQPIALPEGKLAGYTAVRVTPVPAALTQRGNEVAAIIAVVPTREAGYEIAAALYGSPGVYRQSLYANLDGPQSDCAAFADHLHEVFDQSLANARDGYEGRISYRYSDIYTERENGYLFFGGLIFLGMFCALLFIVNTVLIIYFKQISEGLEDRERFDILQKVGMDALMVRKTINFQVLFVFFLPLLVALVHTAFSLPMLLHIMQAFQLYDWQLTVRCALVTALCFCVCYAVVFRLTAHTYYRLVKR